MLEKYIVTLVEVIILKGVGFYKEKFKIFEDYIFKFHDI